MKKMKKTKEKKIGTADQYDVVRTTYTEDTKGETKERFTEPIVLKVKK